MVQTLLSRNLLPSEKIILFEKPRVLSRVFFSVRVMVNGDLSREIWISFGDPNFTAYYHINGSEKYFEAAGEDIFQGDIWVRNISASNSPVAATEILH